MKKIKCVVIEDEAIARNAICAYVKKIDELHLVGTFKNGMEAKRYLEKNEVALIFLDINMPHLNGLELLRIFKKHPPVIFTTAYPEHALDSFEFNVVDYLLKPIPFERFLQAVNKALRFIENTSTPEEKYLILKEGTRVIKIKIADIDFIEAMQNYIRIHTPNQKITVLMTMKEMMTQLPENDFFQTHRSYIVQLQKITQFDGDEISIGKHTIPISKRTKTKFLDEFKNLQ